jgi:hypothetical protein
MARLLLKALGVVASAAGLITVVYFAAPNLFDFWGLLRGYVVILIGGIGFVWFHRKD